MKKFGEMKSENYGRLVLKAFFCALGCFIIGVGVALAKIADIGIDPFNGMCMSAAEFIGIPYTVFTLSINVLLFILEIIWGRKYINIGTFINWFLLCYAVEFSLYVYGFFIKTPSSSEMKIIMFIVAVLIIGLGVAIYQYVNLGISPYDVLPIMFCDRFKKVHYFWARMAVDSISAILILLTNGKSLFGFGTLIIALGLGPIVHIYYNIIKKTLRKLSVLKKIESKNVTG